MSCLHQHYHLKLTLVIYSLNIQVVDKIMEIPYIMMMIFIDKKYTCVSIGLFTTCILHILGYKTCIQCPIEVVYFICLPSIRVTLDFKTLVPLHLSSQSVLFSSIFHWYS